MQTPRLFYETQPYLYVVVGVAAINHFKNFLGFTLGLLLILIAGVIFLMRSNYREDLANMGN